MSKFNFTLQIHYTFLFFDLIISLLVNFVFVAECGRVTTKGGRISPSVRPPLVQVRAPVKVEKPPVAEALAILVHHLVFNVSCF